MFLKSHHRFCFVYAAMVLFIESLLAAPAFAVPVAWQNLQNGLSYAKIIVGTGDDAVELHTLKVNPRYFHLKPVYDGKHQNVRTMLEATRALAMINANFFDRSGVPLGAVVRDGKELHAKKDISWWAVFCLNHKNQADVVPSKQYYKGLCEQAVQSGPRLIVGGVLMPVKDEYSRKSAVGINKNGQIILVASAQSIGMKRLASVFATSEMEGGLDCPDALNLDGGSSSQFYIYTNGLKVILPGFAAVPVGLGVYPK